MHWKATASREPKTSSFRNLVSSVSRICVYSIVLQKGKALEAHINHRLCRVIQNHSVAISHCGGTTGQEWCNPSVSEQPQIINILCESTENKYCLPYCLLHQRVWSAADQIILLALLLCQTCFYPTVQFCTRMHSWVLHLEQCINLISWQCVFYVFQFHLQKQ